MDLLYQKYSNPIEFMNLYINQGRFGEFVDSILELETKKRKEAAEKDNDDKLWMAYIHSYSDKSFNAWKEEVNGQASGRVEKKSLSMTKEEIDDAKSRSRSILKNFSMK